MIMADLFKSSQSLAYFDSIDSNSNDKNCLLIPKLIYNKEDKKEKILSILDTAYSKLTLVKNCDYPVFNFYIFNKDESMNNNKQYQCKLYTVFPNVNFELKQIKNLPFSNTNLNRYLVGKESNPNCSYLEDGFFTMSQNHRLIALKNDINEKKGVESSQSLKQVIFGIWINYSNEEVSLRKKDINEKKSVESSQSLKQVIFGIWINYSYEDMSLRKKILTMQYRNTKRKYSKNALISSRFPPR